MNKEAIKTVALTIGIILLAISIWFNWWAFNNLYTEEEVGEIVEVEIEEVGSWGLFLAEKFDDLNNVFIEYDILIGEYDDLFISDCYTYNVESTNRMYDSIANRYDRIVEDYNIIHQELDDFFKEYENYNVQFQ